MISLIQKMYWNSPYFLKNWMASLNSFKLDRQRYGSEFEQILEQIAEHDKWSPEQFVEYQCQQLQSLIKLAAAKVPYYRRLFSEAGIDPMSIKEPKDLQRLPILEKKIIRTEPKSLLDESLDVRKLLAVHTSGTTGTPLNLYRSVYLNSAAFAYLDARWRNVAGMRRRINRSVTIGGHLVASPARTKPPFWSHNRRWNQLYMSSYHLSPKYLGSYVNEMRKFKAEFIEDYPSSVYAVAKYIIDNNLEPVPFKVCFTTAENLFDYQREAIKKAFKCRTYNQYGSGEQVVFAAECSAGSMHLSPEIGIVEVVDDNDRPVPVGDTGQLICTSLINRVLLFIRYRIGDLGALKAGQCSCGSPLPMLDHIEGRTDAVLITSDGRKIGRLDPIFKGTRGIVEAQVVQDDYDKFYIRIVPASDYIKEDGDLIAKNLTQRVGQAAVKIELVEKIERTKAGKFKAVICNLPKNRQMGPLKNHAFFTKQ